MLTVKRGRMAGSGFDAGRMKKLSTRISVPAGGPSKKTDTLAGAFSNISLPSNRFHSMVFASKLQQHSYTTSLLTGMIPISAVRIFQLVLVKFLPLSPLVL